MRRHPHRTPGFWLIGVLLVVVPIVFGLLHGAAAGQAGAVVSPVSTPIIPPLRPTPTPNIPFCTFVPNPKAVPQPEGHLRVSLGTPQIVLTDTRAIRVGEWSADGKVLLLARMEMAALPEYIDAFDVRTRQLQTLGVRRRLDFDLPFWDQTGKAVLYGALGLEDNPIPFSLSRVEVNGAASGTAPKRTIVARNIVPGMLQLMNLNWSDNTITLFTAAAPRLPLALNPVSGAVHTAAPVLPGLFDWYTGVEQTYYGYESSYRASWNPTGSMAAFHSMLGFFLYNAGTKQLCQVDLGDVGEAGGKVWAWQARWSPTGRYLALLTTVTGRPFRYRAWLTLLDTFDGSLRTIEQTTLVTAVRWLPFDDQGLIFSQRVPNENYIAYDSLRQADVQTVQSYPLMEGMVFANVDYTGMEISPDGRMLAIPCPVKDTPALYDLSGSDSDSADYHSEICLIPINSSMR